MILIVDNYDSFVYNIARYFEELGQQVLVKRNDEVERGGSQGQGDCHFPWSLHAA